MNDIFNTATLAVLVAALAGLALYWLVLPFLLIQRLDAIKDEMKKLNRHMERVLPPEDLN